MEEEGGEGGEEEQERQEEVCICNISCGAGISMAPAGKQLALQAIPDTRNMES